MTFKLIKHILTTCLVFGSLYLHADEAIVAEAANAHAQNTVKLQAKKSPESLFLTGNACLKKADNTCAKMALARISSASPYAKLLQGNIAIAEHQVDESLQLLLPLQAEPLLNAKARISLHQNLARAFDLTEDPHQAMQHLLQAESEMMATASAETQADIASNHQKIWVLLKQLDQSQLVAMRGDSADSEFQGWIDLCLAFKNQDVIASISQWQASYPDHPATTLANSLMLTKAAPQASLPSTGGIALMLPFSADTEVANAFYQGLQAALSKQQLPNEIKIYQLTDNVENISNQQQIDDQYKLAKAEGNIYFIAPDVSDDSIDTPTVAAQNDMLYAGLPLADQAQHIAHFATNHAMQHIAIITTDSEPAQQMLASFRAAWQAEVGAAVDDHIQIITLAQNLLPSDPSLLDLKSQIASQPHDMILLAMPASDAHIIRPHLNISTPTFAFSNIYEFANKNASTPTLNAVRFVDIPFLLATDNDSMAYYRAQSENLDSNTLLRWYALGADTLSLLIAKNQPNDNEVIINGLTGKLTIDKSGTIHRQLSTARFTYNGLELEQ